MIHQQKYIRELLKRFGMDSAKPIDTPISLSTRFGIDSAKPINTPISPSEKEAEEPKSKKAKTSTLPSPNLTKFLQRSVVRGKIVKVPYFKE